MNEQIVINHDDQITEVADKFITILRKLGVKVDDVTKLDDVFVTFRISMGTFQMKTRPDDAAHPIVTEEETFEYGTTKRERFAMEIQGLLMADHDFVLTVKAPSTLEGDSAALAVKGADALILALNEGRE